MTALLYGLRGTTRARNGTHLDGIGPSAHGFVVDHLSLAHCDDSAPPLVLIARKRDDPRRDPAWEIMLDAGSCYEVEARSWRHNLFKRITLAPDAVERIEID